MSYSDLESGDDMDFEFGYICHHSRTNSSTSSRSSSKNRVASYTRPRPLFSKYSDANVLSLLYGCLFFALLLTTIMLYTTMRPEVMELPARHITLGARHVGRMESSRKLVGRHFLATPQVMGGMGVDVHSH